MKQLWIRTAILFAAMLAASVAANAGWLDVIVAHPLGLVSYWAFNAGVFLFLVFGVGLPWLKHLNRSDTPLARLLTAMYRRRAK